MKLKIITLSILALSILTVGCSSDDNGNASNNAITAQDFAVTINENPTSSQSLGTVLASSNETLTYSIVSSTPANTLNIDVNTGELTVVDNTLFDYETNPTITATISVENSTETGSLTATINLTNVNEIGDYNYGGVIFWINAAGNEGLVCAVEDQSTGVQWYNGMSILTNANENGIGTGESNTILIVNAQGAGVYAAKICDDLILNGFNDWFLPSYDELEEMHGNKSIIDNVSLANSGTNIQTTNYWSSTENSLHAAEPYSFTSSASSADFKSATHRVRAVRHWTDF